MQSRALCSALHNQSVLAWQLADEVDCSLRRLIHKHVNEAWLPAAVCWIQAPLTAPPWVFADPLDHSDDGTQVDLLPCRLQTSESFYQGCCPAKSGEKSCCHCYCKAPAE